MSSDPNLDVKDSPDWFRAIIEVLMGSPTKLFIWGLILLFSTQFLIHDWPAPLSPEDISVGKNNTWLKAQYLLHEILRDLGIAFLVAVAISVAIEQIASDKREKDIKEKVAAVQKNAMAAVFNTTLPTGWLEFVRTTLQDRHFYRTSMRVRYDLRHPTAAEKINAPDTEFMICHILNSYQVKNTSYSTEKYAIGCYMELPWEKELERLAQLEAIIVDGVAVDFDEDKAKKSTKRWRFGLAYSHEVEIRGQQSINVEVRIKQVHHPRDTTTFTTIDPADSLHVHLVAPEEFRVYARMKHPMAIGDHGEGRSASPFGFGNLEGTNDIVDDNIIAADVPAEVLAKPADKTSGQAKAKKGARKPILLENDVWVFTPNPCFPSTTVELSWIRRVSEAETSPRQIS